MDTIANRFSIVKPQSFSYPWLFAFTTLAEHDGAAVDFMAGKCEDRRRELEACLAPLSVTWLTLEHRARIVDIGQGREREHRENGNWANCSSLQEPERFLHENDGNVWFSSPNNRGTKNELCKSAGQKAAVSQSFLSRKEKPCISANLMQKHRKPVQNHPTEVSRVSETEGDGAILTEPGTAVAFTTADCLPIICVSDKPRIVAAIHAGWRSLAAGIIEAAIERLRQNGADPTTLRVWIGPAVACEDYEVSDEVRDRLLLRPAVTESCFRMTRPGHWLADLPGAASAILNSLGVPSDAIERYPISTAQDRLLHSVRRDGKAAGRMATAVGIL